jgi:uncharacterized membrane protein YdcZ (DUF606 family)
VALVFAVPFMLLAAYLARGDRQSAAAPWLILLGLAGFVIGGGVAAMSQRLRLPISHGMIAATLAFVVPQAVLIIIQALRGNDIDWLASLFNLSAVVVCGTIGGALGSMMQRRGLTLPSAPTGDTITGHDG